MNDYIQFIDVLLLVGTILFFGFKFNATMGELKDSINALRLETKEGRAQSTLEHNKLYEKI